jgi:hypothetical protein
MEKNDPLLRIFLEKKLRQTNTILKETKNKRDVEEDSTLKYEYRRDNYIRLLSDIID